MHVKTANKLNDPLQQLPPSGARCRPITPDKSHHHVFFLTCCDKYDLLNDTEDKDESRTCMEKCGSQEDMQQKGGAFGAAAYRVHWEGWTLLASPNENVLGVGTLFMHTRNE